MAGPSFHGRTILSFESRLSSETASLIEKYRGRPVEAPSMQEVPLDEHAAVYSFAEALLSGYVDVLICLTGVGTRMMIDTMSTRHDRAAVIAALRNIPIVSRGPKPAAALRDYDLKPAVKIPEPNTWREILTTIDETPLLQPLAGKHLAVQEYGMPNPELIAGLEMRGATVEQVSIYRWTLPDDIGPLKRGIQALMDGKIDVVIFTSRTQVDHVTDVARENGLFDRLMEAFARTFVASIGPVCTEGLRQHGIEPNFEPTRPKLGVLMRELADTIENAESAGARGGEA